MKNFLLTCLLFLGLSANAMAQEEVTIKGVVTDTNGEPLIGANIIVKDMPGLGTITDLDGAYS